MSSKLEAASVAAALNAKPRSSVGTRSASVGEKHKSYLMYQLLRKISRFIFVYLPDTCPPSQKTIFYMFKMRVSFRLLHQF